MAITGRFVALLVVGLVPVVLLGASAPGAYLALACWLVFCCMLGAIDLAAASSPRRVLLARMLPAGVRLGETVVAQLLVTNLGSRRLHGRLRDGWDPSAGASPTRLGLDVPPGERRMLTLALTPHRRGTRRAAFVAIRAAGPLGLWSRQATLASPAELRVLPPFHSRRHLASRIARLRELEGATPVMVRGEGTEFDSLREYVAGDDVRSIDWRATARTPTAARAGSGIMVRTWRPERDRRIVIVIDTGRASAARIADEPRLDTAFECALLLAALADRGGDRVDVVAFDRRVRARVMGAKGAPLLSRLVTALADVQPELIETDWSAVPAQVRAITHRHALVVLLTDASAPGSSSGLLAALPQLTATHTVVVASARDPRVAELAAERDGVESFYGAAAAERALLDTARVAEAVRLSGADAISAPPTELPPALADRYLQLKASGRL
ncbi:DUF58 domain-containing protein [Humibacter antri]